MESDSLLNRLAGRPFEDVQASFCAVLVDEWIRQGIRLAMIAPGSRSTPMALALAARSEIHIEVFHDERSAAFAALGVGLATNSPAVLLCTSGTAAAHFYAAIIEADLSHVPLLVVTADRPPELKDVGAAQTIDQTKMYGNSVRWFHDPGVACVEASHTWRSMARQSFAATTGLRPGPCHINMPFREPLVGTSIDVSRHDVALSQVQGSPSIDTSSFERLARQFEQKDGLIVVGRGCGNPISVSKLAKRLGWPVLADSRSGCQGIPEAVVHFDSILRHREFAESHCPSVVVRFGEAPSSKVLGQFITHSAAMQVHISSFDNPYDADHQVQTHIICDPESFCTGIGSFLSVPENTDYQKQWLRAENVARGSIAEYHARSEGQLNGPLVSRTVTQCLPPLNNLVVSSSMPIRDLEWFGGDCSHLYVFSNRGANGIDGVIATAIGVAVATQRSTTVLIGDIAFLHDSSSLVALASRTIDVKIVVTDNDGGGIFHYLSQATMLDHSKFEKLFGTPHGSDILNLAQAHQLKTFDCVTATELQSALTSAGSCVIRVVTNRHDEVVIHQHINSAVEVALESL